MYSTRTTMSLILACMMITAYMHAEEPSDSSTARHANKDTSTVVTTAPIELPKVELSDLLDGADMVVVGRIVLPPVTCITVTPTDVRYRLSNQFGRSVSLPKRGGFELFEFAVEEVVAATEDSDTIKDKLVAVGNGATGVYVLTRTRNWETDVHPDPRMSYGDGSLLLFLKNVPVSDTDAAAIKVATTSMVFRIVLGSVGCARMNTGVIPCRVADAISSEEVLQVAKGAARHLAVSNTNNAHNMYSGANTGLYWKTIQQLDNKRTPKKFKTTGKKIEQQIINPYGKPMR